MNALSALADDKVIIITKQTMTNCALVTKNDDDFKECCFSHSFTNTNDADTDNENNLGNISSDNTGENITINNNANSKYNLYNKNDEISARPLFNYTYTYAKKQCNEIGYFNSDGDCVCNNGGDFSNNHCWCPNGSWQKDGKCICQPGTQKYEYSSGVNKSLKTFSCQDDGYVNPYTFSDTTDYTYPSRNTYHDPDFVDWSDPLEVFWYHYEKSGEEVGMTFTEAFKMRQERNKNGTGGAKITIWKAFGITASNETDNIVLDVVGDAKCITPDANLDADSGTECVCTVISVSSGSIQEKWVYNPFAKFYVTTAKTEEDACKKVCTEKCAEAFAKDEYNVRYSLMKHWEP